MKSFFAAVALLCSSTSVFAGYASNISKHGQAPETLTHEPGPGMALARFQVLYIDDKTCPSGQIKKYTAGSKKLGISATRECVDR